MSVAPPPSEPRVGHYLFAHRGVPRAFLRDPAPIMGILGSDDAMAFLSGMWDVIDKELEPDQHLPRGGLGINCYELESDIFIALVTMPPPARVLESYFVALAARLEGETLARAFSLALAGPPGPDPLVGVLEWDVEGERTLLQPTCNPEASAFVDTVETILTPPT